MKPISMIALQIGANLLGVFGLEAIQPAFHLFGLEGSQSFVGHDRETEFITTWAKSWSVNPGVYRPSADMIENISVSASPRCGCKHQEVKSAYAGLSGTTEAFLSG
jgi:hypothetical protein